MKVLFFSRLFYPYIGGVERHVMELGKRLVERGHRVTVVTEILLINTNTTNLKSISNEEKIGGIKVLRIPVGKSEFFKKFRIWWWLWKHRKLIKETDIVHCHDVFFWYLPFRLFFPRKKVFTTFHGYEDYPISKKTIIVRKISEWLSVGNICIGDFIKKWYKTNPTFISYGGVSVPGRLNGKSYKKESAIFIGRLDEQTGILTYLRAFKLIKRKIPGFEFIVIGDGKFKNKIGKDVNSLGFQENPEKYFSEYRFAFVSRYLSILEAMVAKRLVFAVYDNPIKKDYLMRAPFADFIVVVENSYMLAKSVAYYLSHPKEEEKKVEKGYEWVQKQTWDNVVSLYLSLWKNKM